MRKVSCAMRVANFGPVFVAFARGLRFCAILAYCWGHRAVARCVLIAKLYHKCFAGCFAWCNDGYSGGTKEVQRR